MKISDKLSKVDEDFNIMMIDNGYIIDVRGQGHDGDWTNAKLFCKTLEQLFGCIADVDALPRNS